MPTTTQVIIPPDDPLPPPPDRTLIAPDKIAADLRAAILADATLAAAYTVTQYGSTLHIEKTSGDFTPYVQDTLDNTGLSIVKGSVTGADQLPDQAPEGHRIQITGDPTTKVDDYWMVFTGGHWTEAPAPGVQTTLDNSLMPWRLTSTGVGAARAFAFGPAEWTVRDAGDDTSNPLPPLDAIDTLFVTEGRLGFTAGPNVVLSASNEPLRIFRRSVAQLLPNDPISVRSTLGNVGRYHAVIEWNGETRLWSNKAQRAIHGDPALTPTTVMISPTSSFENDPECLPIVCGSTVYFAREVKGKTRVFEYTLPPGYNAVPEVNDLTAAVPTYLDGAPRMLIADESLGFLAVIMQGTGSTIYVCNLRAGQNGTVGVWHRWTFNGSIAAARMIGTQMLVLISRSGALHLELLDVGNPADTASGPVADAGGTAVVPQVVFSSVLIQDQGGPDATARVTLRNMTLFHRDSRSGTVTFNGDASPSVSVTSLIPDDELRIPVMRTLKSLGFTLSWTGFITNIELQGSFVTRSPRK